MKSNYYYGMQPKPISLETVKHKALIRQIFNDSKQSAGARSIAAILMNEHGIKLTRYIAGKFMAQMGLKSCQLKMHKYKHADEAHKTHHNILNRNFSQTAPNQVWTGDVTYIRIKGGWCYLAVVLDLYARRIVGFAVSDSPDSMLTTKALQMAYQTRLQPIGVLFHSDQGTHYTSKKFAESVASCEGMTQSMSRRGNCWDNAPTERFFRSFKTEWMPKGGYENITEAKIAISNYIWGYYQTVRPHTFNDYLTPLEKEKRYFNKNLLSGVLN
ncbi:transposase OrfAB subunit B [Psychrobacter sp. DAB_AL43B]|nr:transposase orfAB [Psychrobacter sp. DAB_AL43B]SLJ83595.1 transposase orfAB [Psychrobacter sp. DAB_AL43B]SLJ83771.1 transposase orfAB [Psychrobacter sp. DAB_AL43B]SLJ84260.1 transposase OrfAB subunit B [Psychrobacter sp. DAB_AL43B]SLJ84268.1 transposase OrfAB subunit B [Psychrobacter sp. DAB_AL43B]